MKKLSLLLVFVALLATLFALSTFAAHTLGGKQLITDANVALMYDADGNPVLNEDGTQKKMYELVGGTSVTGGWGWYFESEPNNVLDGDYTSLWSANANGCIRITFENEWEITSIKALQWTNSKGVSINCFAADGTKIAGYYYGGGASGGGWNWTPSSADANVDYTAMFSDVTYAEDKPAVKYIELFVHGTYNPVGIRTHELYIEGRERIPSVGCTEHVWAEELDPAPTCTETGTLYRWCEVCMSEDAPAEVPALGHIIGSVYEITKQPDCQQVGEITFDCTREGCGQSVVRDLTLEDVTDYADKYSAKNEGAGGLTTQQDIPNQLFDGNDGSILQASGGWYIQSEITLDMPYYISSISIWTGFAFADQTTGDFILTLSYKAPGETEWTNVVFDPENPDAHVKVAPTDLNAWAKTQHIVEFPEVQASAIKVRVDSVDDFSGFVSEVKIKGSVVANAGGDHIWGEPVVVEPSCDHTGYTQTTCTVCGESKTTDPVPAIEHTWSIEPTCTTGTTCSVCGREQGDKLGHDMQAATCTTPSTCSRCGYAEGETSDHSYVAGEQAEDGSVTYTCANCDDFYVINNSAVNGEYFLGTDAVVFLDGVLTAMGGEYTYTYNVTTGMIDTNDETIYFQVIDGKIYFKGAEVLHQHIFEECVEEAQEDGSVNYVCQICGEVAFVVNNSAINGEYFLGTDAVVFADGVLTAMGGEYTYTYNVTTGMIDTNDAGIYFQVIDGAIYFKGAQQLHQHTGEGYVAEEQENGAVNYVCPFCGAVMYVINNSALNGEYFLGTDAVVFADGVLTVMGSEYTYTYNETTGMVDTNDAGIFFQVIDGVLYFRGAQQLHQHNEADLIVETTDATCTENGSVVTICPFCGPLGEETIEATGHIPTEEYYEGYVYEGATCTTEGYCTDLCGVCGEEYTVTFPIDPENHMADWSTAEYKDTTCQEDGYEKYTCLNCGEEIVTVYEANEDAHVWDQDLYEYVAPTCKDGGYEYNKCSLCGAEVTTEFGPSEWAHDFDYDNGVEVDGFMVYTCTLCGATEEEEIIVYPELPLGDTAIEIVASDWGMVESVYYSVSVPGDYVLTIDAEKDNVYIILGEYSSELIEINTYEFTVNEGDVVTFSFVTGDFAAGTVNVNLANKSAHVHTEEIIPAILPTPSVTGYTAGVKCSECEAILEAPKAINVTDMADTKDPNFRVAAASLTLMDSIVVNYKSVVSAGYNNPYMVFVFKGEEYMVESSGVEAGTGRLIFDFDKVEAHWMNENIEAYVYAETAEGEYSRNMILEYSVKNYAINQLKKNDAALTTVISDLLVMGAKTQLYTGYKTNELVTDAVEAAGYTLTPTAFAGVDESYNIATPVTGDRTTGTDWKSGTVYLGSRTVLQLKFLTDDVETLVVKVTVGNKTETYTKEDFDYEASSGRYVVNVDFFSAKQYGEPVVGTFERNGEQVGSTITYSVNAYAYRNANSASGATQELIKALYVYGQSVEAYFG